MYFSEWQKMREEKNKNLPANKKEKRNRNTKGKGIDFDGSPLEPSDYEHFPMELT
jgi:hypothetical protein